MTRCIHERDHKSCEECRPSDHARITPQELAEKVRAGIETYHYPEAEWHQALEALAELVRLAEEAERANLEWQSGIDYAQERAEAAEAVLRKIAGGTHLVDHFYEGPECRCGQQIARAALGEGE